ncbi:MAG TPA: spermidine synthase, partial [Actinomycetota bacterium]|nr:spermidine synthase [Actinomycetota bacterium]
MTDPRARLVLLSFLMLFVELVLIRWTAANVVYLAFFTNFVLLASFLGIGIGFLRANLERDGFLLAPLALGLFVGFVFLFPVQWYAVGRRSGHFGLPPLPQWIELPVIFLGAAAVMAVIAEGVARTFATFEPLEAYRLDIVGSLLGIVGFSVLSFLHAPPIAWAAVILLVFWVLLGRRIDPLPWGALGIVVIVFALQSFLPNVWWSPYYKVNTTDPDHEGTIRVRVNNLAHQSIHPLDLLRDIQPFYYWTYEMLEGHPLRDVLIVGAGTGNDVALALSQGAERVVAVEIDPVLQDIGSEQHPDRPYQDPRVEVHIDDGRAYLERTDERFDLILFALPDSLTLVAGQGALRLESYLFTREALARVRDRLRPDGAFSAYNYYSPVVFRRYAHTLELVFGHPPCIRQGGALEGRRQWVMVIGQEAGSVRCPSTPVSIRNPPEPATDDHPFPYLRERGIPTYHLIALALILAASVVLVRLAGGRLSRMSSYLDLFFMGTAFLLLETKSIVQFALLFGTTWFVNALVFAGVLLAVLAAIEVARRFRLPAPWVLYLVLFAALVVAWLVPARALLALPLGLRFLAGTVITFAPIFLANLVFSQRFKDTASSVTAFGANLLGAMLGGVLEYGSLVIGFRALVIGVAALYGLAYLFG